MMLGGVPPGKTGAIVALVGVGVTQPTPGLT